MGQVLEKDPCGCGVGSAMPLEQAMIAASQLARPVSGFETLPLGKSSGRVLAQPVLAAGNVPIFAASAMDGFAIRSHGLKEVGRWRLAISQRIVAGAEAAPLLPGTAARIFTGAPIPMGADTVVMQENATYDDQTVTFHNLPPVGSNIRHAGEEIAAGQEVLAAGTQMTARAIAVAASAGIDRVSVRRQVRVALLTTGDEVRPAGSTLRAGQINDVNTPMLSALLAQHGAQLVMQEHVADTLAAHMAALTTALAHADLIITSGGVSVGEEDHMRAAVQAMGARVTVPSVALKPVKPVTLGHIGDACWIGLPGNPMSAFVTFLLLGLPVLAGLSGAASQDFRQNLRAANTIVRSSGRAEVRPASLDRRSMTVTIGGTVHSGRMSPLLDAGGCVIIPADVTTLPTGAPVDFIPFPQGA
ncbi:molybdopterin molybdotransferase MoeA [Donghicola tyrosinivorans]|uniref:Molybdopterin molybdenumtransferase n=1 Tax=Donghicola tyrosinivorans TaxID=1652492 RepID=A0A2T0WHF4_9RHOB|nr:molybdopterin molybdotransferase MoeA [Donghicola tyrosinivorans]PRY86143.1 molybdopterin molybdotransferase [Donghicola tyrosinivorans]